MIVALAAAFVDCCQLGKPPRKPSFAVCLALTGSDGLQEWQANSASPCEEFTFLAEFPPRESIHVPLVRYAEEQGQM